MGAEWTMHRSPVWLALVLVGCLTLPAPGQVLLSEVWVVQLFELNPHYDVPETVVLTNHGAEPVDLAGWSLTTSPGLAGPGSVDSWALPVGTTLPAGEELTIYWSVDMADPGRLSTGPDPLARLNNVAGDLALRSPSGLVHYLEWGAAGQAQEAEAVAAGMWQDGQYLEVWPVDWWMGSGFRYDYDNGRWQVAMVIDSAVRGSGWAEVKATTEAQ